MNNSRLAVESVSLSIESPVDLTEELSEREAKLVRWIDALNIIQKTNEWSSLKEIFEPLTESINKQLLSESKKPSPDTNKLNRLSGELKWSERYSDLKKFEKELRVELQNLRQKLYGKTT